MVEAGNNLDPDDEFDFFHNILDFPMEWLDEDEVAKDWDWDLNNPQCLGPIPSDVLMGTSMISDDNFNLKSPSLFPRPVAPAFMNKAEIPPKRKFAKVQESGSICTQSPVSILESSGSYSREKSLPIKSDNDIPVQSRSKRVRNGGINPRLLAERGISTSIQTSNARRSKKVVRKRLFQQPGAMDLVESSSRNVDSSSDGSGPDHLQNTSKPCLLAKKCAHCQTRKTPLWRWGPLGRNTLCNACGVRFRSGRLFPEYRPAESPTFVPSQHSNSHGKVEETRNNAEGLSVKIKIKPRSCIVDPPRVAGALKEKQLADHVDTSCEKRPAGAITQLLASPSTCRKISNAGAGKECRKKSCHLPVAIDVSDNDESSLAISDPARVPAVVKRCAHCQTTQTPQWRGGPLGRNTLCNACGVRFRSGCLLPEYRPAASPTFVPSQHSNRHSKVVKMRINAVRSTAESKQDIIYISDSEATS